ncbi:hypothetical protein [Conexibacter arvalis]|uniref:hypothetical protein n=1 Tax=Conexibacter arvalis TaxID=912552 RepID=UPI001FEA4A0C|nr:hypothetical protein [Conexibacter arvalis]
MASRSVLRRITGRIWRITRSKTGRVRSTSSTKRSRGIVAIRPGVSASIRTWCQPSVSVGIAPTHVGATWTPSGSTRPSATEETRSLPASSRWRP